MFIAPTSSKRIELSGAPSTGKTHSLGTIQNSSTLNRWKGNLHELYPGEQRTSESQVIGVIWAWVLRKHGK